MKRVCSLDYLYKETFETDITNAEGKVLVSIGTSVTPEILLKLYFHDTYAQEQKIEEEVVEIIEVIDELKSSTGSQDETVVLKEFESGADAAVRGDVATSAIVVDLAAIGHRDKSDEADEADEADGTDKDDKSAESDTDKEGADNEASSETEIDADGNIKGSGLKSASKNAKDKSTKTIESPVEEPEDKQLKFDEEVAKRLVDYSVKLGKELGFSKAELKEIEEVAYNYNIAITQFTTDDLLKRGFRKTKVRAAYEYLSKANTVSEKVIESVKLCANNYESESFALNAKIPYHHIVAVTSYYEELLAQYSSKNKTLAKMMELGGNKFNIFVLHKFIRIMREANE